MSVDGSDGHCLDPLEVGRAHETKSSMGSKVQYIQVQVGTPRYLPWWGSFTLSDTTLWIMRHSLVEGPRNESRGTSGAFGGL